MLGKWLFSIFFMMSTLEAQTVWINPGSGDWDDPNNWSMGVPEASSDAAIDNGGSALLSSSSGDGAYNLYVGYSSNLSNNLSVTGACFTFNCEIGSNPFSNGSMTVNGSDSGWRNFGFLTIGNFGSGSLNVENGAVTFTTYSSIGLQPGSLGVVNVLNSGDCGGWGNADLKVGESGTGILNVLDHGFVESCGETDLGGHPTGQGYALVDESLWTNDNITVAKSGKGGLLIQNGGEVDACNAIIGLNNSSIGTAIVQGFGSKWINSKSLSIGVQGQASLLIDSGGLVCAPFTTMNNSQLYLNGSLGSQGILSTGEISSTGPFSLISFYGGILQATRDNPNWLLGFSPNQILITEGSAFFDTQNYSVSISSPLAGIGSLYKQGEGLLILNGMNSYAGGTIIESGTLQGSSISIPNGNIVNNGTLIFDQPINGTFSGNISGTGLLIKEGAAMLQLNCDGSGFNGSTTILEGNLNVNGILGGTFLVNAGAMLSGNAILGHVNNNGILKPGNSIGTVQIKGNFITSGILQTEINGSGMSSLVDVSGNALVNGGELIVIADPGIYLAGTTYTLIQAAGGITGQFASTFLPNIAFALNYLPNGLTLQVLKNSFNSPGLYGNPLRVAEYIRDHIKINDDILTVVKELNTLDPSQLYKALDQLHPSLFQSLAIATGDAIHMINTTIIERLDNLRNACSERNCNLLKICGGLWVAGSADFLRQSKSGGLRRFSTSSEGFSFGYDYRVSHDLFVGIGAGYSHTLLHWGNAAGKAGINGYYLGPYLSHVNDSFYVDATLLSFVNRDHVRRNIRFAEVDRTAKNKHNCFGFSPHLGVGLFLDCCSIEVIPFFEIDYYLVQQNHFRERGAETLNLHVKRNQSHLLRVETGLQLARCYTCFKGHLLPHLSISWVGHRIIGGKKFISSFQNIDANFSVQGTNSCFNQLELGAGLKYMINNELAIHAWYDAELGRKRQEQQINLEINYNF